MTPQRIHRRRIAGWRIPEGAVYVGRPGPWGNRFEHDGTPEGRATAAARYRQWIEARPAWMNAARRDLAGRDLACWCPLGQSCHADVLLAVANDGQSPDSGAAGSLPDADPEVDGYTVDPQTGCWEWMGYADKNGYGRIYDPTRPAGRRIDWAHRVFYERHKGKIPPKHEIDHVCQNTICVNPEHLDAVTRVEHVARTLQRLGIYERHRIAAELRALGITYAEIAEVLSYTGREAAHAAVLSAIEKGFVKADELPQPVRLTEQEREDVKHLHALGVPQIELAAWYRVDSSFISRICNDLTTRKDRQGKGQVA